MFKIIVISIFAQHHNFFIAFCLSFFFFFFTPVISLPLWVLLTHAGCLCHPLILFDDRA